ncbi:MAG: FkbM family methyltransferase [Limisphaerales bacterium]
MSIAAKAMTLLRLVARGDWQTVRSRWLYNTATRRAGRHGGKSFVHHDMGYPAVCHPDWVDSLDQFCNMAGDHWEAALLRDWLRPGDAAIDAGANLGLYSFALADRVGQQGRVLAVDADLFIIEKLRAAAQLLDATQIKPLHAAVADQTGTLTFYVRSDRFSTAEQSLVPSEGTRGACRAVATPALTIADLIRELDRQADLALIKVDIEGAEAMAFRTVPADLLREDGPFWLVEIHPGALARFGATPADIVKCFPMSSFELWLLPKHPLAHVTEPLKLRRLTESELFAESLYYNLLAVPRGQRWRERRLGLKKYLPLDT